MTQTVANVRIWEGAAAFFAPVGTTAPVDLVTALPAAWLDLGAIGVDSGDQNLDSESNDFYVRTANGETFARTTSGKFKRTFVVAAAEDNLNVLAITEPDSVATTLTGLTTIVHKQGAGTNEWAIVLEIGDGVNLKRRSIPRAQVNVSALPRLFGSEPGVTELTLAPYFAADGTWGTTITNESAYTA